jgi:hypothetical protein
MLNATLSEKIEIDSMKQEKINYESKGENNERKRSLDALLGQ